MARPLRIEYPGAWYHVMNRGLGRKQIFLSSKDRFGFFDILGDTSETFSAEIHAYSLMDNHYHLLIHTPKGGLGRAMRHLNGVYTQQFNKRHRTDGPLFRGRYKALLVESDEYLLQLLRYIHLNPVEAGVCRDPLEHAWTSHGAYLRPRLRPQWLVCDEVLGRFGSMEKRALREMHAYVCAGVPKAFRDDLKKHPVILGTKGFQDWVYENFGDKHTIKSKEISRTSKVSSPSLSPKRILENVAYAYGVKVLDLRQSVRGMENEGRNVAVYLMRRFTGLPLRDIATWFNCSSAYTVATIQKRVKERMIKEKRFQRKIRVIENSVQPRT